MEWFENFNDGCNAAFVWVSDHLPALVMLAIFTVLGGCIIMGVVVKG